MQDRLYRVRDTNGKLSPPTPETQLYQLARSGFLAPTTLLQESLTGRWYRAGELPALVTIFRSQRRAAGPLPPLPPSFNPDTRPAVPEPEQGPAASQQSQNKQANPSNPSNPSSQSVQNSNSQDAEGGTRC
jgi:hypothetical protein